MTNANFTRINPADDVVVALTQIAKGSAIEGVTLLDDIPAGHKVAMRAIAKGAAVLKYGSPFGQATAAIAAGEHVHLHNVASRPGLSAVPDHEIASEQPALPALPAWARDAMFAGYRRPDGRVGTANWVAIIPTVNCSVTVARQAAEQASAALRPLLAQYPNIDGVVAIPHATGCGVAANSPQHRQVAQCLANLANHPNVGLVVYVGLGCEVGQFTGAHQAGLLQIQPLIGESRTDRAIEHFVIQRDGGTAETVAGIVAAVQRHLPELNRQQRQLVPASELILGMNCGGSDGYSGLTANPLVGDVANVLAALGATAVLAETPETWGAHAAIARRAKNAAVGKKFLNFFPWWERYMAIFTELHGFAFSINGNPSDGNKRGGLTTIEEKSLGAATKGGSTQLNAAYDYGAMVDPHMGFTFMNTPGLDQVSMTGLICGGCNLNVFTTGNGSCLGTVLAPTIKIATNSRMFNRMRGDMDFDAGQIVAGRSRAELAQELFAYMLDVASGRQKTRSQVLGYGPSEFEIWNIGPTY